jgi:nitroreductase
MSAPCHRRGVTFKQNTHPSQRLQSILLLLMPTVHNLVTSLGTRSIMISTRVRRGILLIVLAGADALISSKSRRFGGMRVGPRRVFRASADESERRPVATTIASSFDKTMLSRYACTRYQRYDGNMTSTMEASCPNQTVVDIAFKCLDLARRAPSGFNAQPYKLVLVHSPEQKKAMAKHCIGGNAYRVRDSDCTAIFLADREVVRSMPKYGSFLKATSEKRSGQRGPLLKIQVLIAMFSSGYPLPRILSVPISFCVRAAVSVLSILIGRWMPLPSLSGAETWATKNTMLVAMAYMLGCTANGVSTTPMEGFNGPGIRNALKIPRRYSIPLIVSTGMPYLRPVDATETLADSSDDVGMKHGKPGTNSGTPRYPIDEVIFGDVFGAAMA